METCVRERGIIFSEQMVNAILRGHKTQTRRVMKPQLQAEWACLMPSGELAGIDPEDGSPIGDRPLPKRGWLQCPYGGVGDRLWVKEKFRTVRHMELCEGVPLHFAADFDEYTVREKGPWRSPLFMPRWASRITLEITDVRVQRGQHISEADAGAEGVQEIGDSTRVKIEGKHSRRATDKECFAWLWDTINSNKYPWASNPWVWALTFKRVDAASESIPA